MYYVIYHDGHYSAIIDEKGKPNKYGKIKFFHTKQSAEDWVKRRTYIGMSHSYEICEEGVE